ncbi:MAG: glycosyltransferase [Phycisphaerales bacterium]
MVEPAPPRSDSRPAGRSRVALAHDWLVGLRGGELVLDRIARVVRERFDPAGLWTMFDDGRPLTPAIDGLSKHVSALNRYPAGARRWLLARYPAAVRELSRDLARAHAERPIDLVVSTSSAAIKGLEPPPGVAHLCYCHAPARYLWGQRREYARGSVLRRAGLTAFGPSLRAWDVRTAASVTRFLANSTHTADEIRRVYGRDADVVHPPVRAGYFTPDPNVEREDFWVVAGALEPYKRTDLAIGAAIRADRRLIVVGDGSESTRLRRIARNVHGIEFLGRVPDDRLRDLYRRARCLIHPQVEDFGIIAVEAQACGCPVVALRAGGALDTVRGGVTGVFFDEQTPDAIGRAAGACPADAAACRAHAETFGEDRFDARITKIFGEMWN